MLDRQRQVGCETKFHRDMEVPNFLTMHDRMSWRKPLNLFIHFDQTPGQWCVQQRVGGGLKPTKNFSPLLCIINEHSWSNHDEFNRSCHWLVSQHSNFTQISHFRSKENNFSGQGHSTIPKPPLVEWGTPSLHHTARSVNVQNLLRWELLASECCE